ncbi:MAG: DNA mismatch repair protein MutS [Bacillota bacterium]|nr:DNA mismatch repair protein MutS [Bacillota bacterium]
MTKYTPMIEQYLSIKEQNEDAILLFRLGDFYEMFFEDAKKASKELEIVLTARDGGAGKIPMCGVPHHAVNNYIARLVGKGYKVAICDQVEDPRSAAGIVKREVTRIITAGTILDDIMLDEGKNNYLVAAIVYNQIIGFTYIDISTGDFWVTERRADDTGEWLDNELQRINPSECLIPSEVANNSLWTETSNHRSLQITTIDFMSDVEEAEQYLTNQFGVNSLQNFGIKHYTAGLLAAAAILSYLNETQKGYLSHIQRINLYHSEEFMELDGFTRRNLELTLTLREHRKQGSLLDVLDACSTPIGKRLLRKWLEQPLLNENDINLRLDAVGELKDKILLRENLKEHLKKVYDLERLAGKLGSGLVTPRELLSLRYSLEALAPLKDELQDSSSPLLVELSALNLLPEVVVLITDTLDDDAPINVKEGGLIKSSFSEEIDELKQLSSQGTNWLLEFENREKEATGIKHLKVSYNKVFGYYIEVSKSNIGLVPDHYIRKQTLVNTERYITQELKVYEDKIINSRQRLFELEYQVFLQLKEQIQPYIGQLLQTAHKVAVIDVLTSLAITAYMNDYVRPTIVKDGTIDILAGRHPVVERALIEGRFVPNDLQLNPEDNRFAIITGPNMGGKSTYMRQAAIIQIMAQMGSFIPADKAALTIVDRIFTRVGASDDLSAGQSTFMVEMVELAHILSSATSQSFIILDEIGRGTSTYDGLSIARAVTEYINHYIKAKTLFATHYHELTSLGEEEQGIFNLFVSVMESGEKVTFLKKVLQGKADKSYGIHVAKLAGLPDELIERANVLLDSFEQTKTVQPVQTFSQGNLFDNHGSEIINELERISPDGISPKEALNLLYKWKEML